MPDQSSGIIRGGPPYQPRSGERRHNVRYVLGFGLPL